MRRILDHRQPMLAGQPQDGGHVTGVAAIMHHQHGARVRR